MSNEQKQEVMKTQKRELIKKEIEKQAKEANLSSLEMITKMQTICAMRNDEETLSALIDIKNDYIADLFK